jgi:hypothetical protein
VDETVTHRIGILTSVANILSTTTPRTPHDDIHRPFTTRRTTRIVFVFARVFAYVDV